MQRVLIGHSSEFFAGSIARKLGSAFETHICLDGAQMGRMLDAYKPDILILHSAMPCKDTLTILYERPVLPRLTLITVNYLDCELEWQLRALGVRQILLMPSPGEVVQSLQRCLSQREDPCGGEVYRVHLQLLALSFDTQLEGFHLICSAVPQMMKDPRQTLSKHIYPAIAKEYGLSDQRAVEHSIRNSIEKAWRHRNEIVWSRFFPADETGQIPCPSNRKVLTSLVEWAGLKD